MVRSSLTPRRPRLAASLPAVSSWIFRSTDVISRSSVCCGPAWHPLTAGMATRVAAFDRDRPTPSTDASESNMYLVDGGQNVNRMDGGYALKLPVEAIAEFRILTPERTTEYWRHGRCHDERRDSLGQQSVPRQLYEFVRNDAFDARNFFSEKVEPLRQNQFGGTIGGPIAQNRLLFFGYYEGFRNKQGYTTTATVPSDLQRTGDFSDLGTPLINFAAGGVPIPGNTDPDGGAELRGVERAEHVSTRQCLADSLP